MFQGKNKAVFLDRDGTLNKDFEYVYRIEQLELLPGVIEALEIIRDAGFLLICALIKGNRLDRTYWPR